MHRIITLSLAAFLCLVLGQLSFGEEVLFEDKFEGKLSPKWKIVGLKKEDYRIKNGELEMRVQPGEKTKDSPMLKVLIPFEAKDNVTASVDLTIVDKFTEPTETAGLYLINESGPEFRAEKRKLNGLLVFSPAKPEFIGKQGEDGDPQQYALKFWPANESFGALQIIVSSDRAFFQVGPSKDGKYLNLFHSAIITDRPGRGFGLRTCGGPADKEHWVRFDNFRVVRDGRN
ncbi:MAG: hypothetical protein SGJ20_20130 [Planctomycetota bacterium]|nr:hypothetical protein [Planctomycetota bacterium]